MVPEVSLTGLFVVAAVAFAGPMLLGLKPRLRLPAVVLEILAGIAIGPSGLNWVQPDVAIEVLGLIGLAMLLFLAGMEVAPERFRGRLLKVSLVGFVISIVVGLAFGLTLTTHRVRGEPPPVRHRPVRHLPGADHPRAQGLGQAATQLGQLTISASSIADFGAVILLSLLFSGEGSGPGSTVFLLVAFGILAAAIGLALAGAGRSMWVSQTLLRLQDTTAEIRVRGAILLMVGFAALAEGLGLEVILAAFIAGALLKLVDRDVMLTHPNFRLKLEAIGYGFVIPVFFISSGLRFDAAALFESTSSLVRVPVFLAVLLLVRGLPALTYGSIVGRRGALAAALLQATSLPFIVAATQIGLELGAVSETNAAALVGAGLLSVIVFPITALKLLRGSMPAEPSEAAAT